MTHFSLQANDGNNADGRRRVWKRRRPRWLMVERAYLHLMFRISQARFRWWPTADHPEPTLDLIPPCYKVGYFPTPCSRWHDRPVHLQVEDGTPCCASECAS